MVRAVIWGVLSGIFRAPGCVVCSSSSKGESAYSSVVRINPRFPCSPPPILEESDCIFFNCFFSLFSDSYKGSTWTVSINGKSNYAVAKSINVEAIILEIKWRWLQFTDNCFPVAIRYFLFVVETYIKKYCLRYADNNFTSCCWLFSAGGGVFDQKISKLCCRCK